MGEPSNLSWVSVDFHAWTPAGLYSVDTSSSQGCVEWHARFAPMAGGCELLGVFASREAAQMACERHAAREVRRG